MTPTLEKILAEVNTLRSTWANTKYKIAPNESNNLDDIEHLILVNKQPYKYDLAPILLDQAKFHRNRREKALDKMWAKQESDRLHILKHKEYING